MMAPPTDPPRLEIRTVLELADTAFVIARLVRGGDVAVSDGSRLGGLALEPELDRPRTSQIHDEVTTELYIFTLRHQSDARHLAAGQVVALTPPEPEP